MDMEQMNELELLKQLPISKRVDILEERVLDLEKLIEKYNEFIKYLQCKNQQILSLEVKYEVFPFEYQILSFDVHKKAYLVAIRAYLIQYRIWFRLKKIPYR